MIVLFSKALFPIVIKEAGSLKEPPFVIVVPFNAPSAISVISSPRVSSFIVLPARIFFKELQD